MKQKITLQNSIDYIVGHIRYYLYYSQNKKFIRKHIIEQIDFRIAAMNKECYLRGTCIKCGCKTTALQMCNSACKGYCYPKMKNRKDWESYKKKYNIDIKKYQL